MQNVQKLKKALKKLANFKTPGKAVAASRPASQPAKKTPPTKKKSAPVAPMKKAGAKKPAPPPQVIKKVAPKGAAAPAAKGKPHPPQKPEHKGESKDKKKPVVHAKEHEKHADKAAKKPTAPTAHAPIKKAEKATVAPAVKPAEAKAKKPEAPAREEAEAKGAVVKTRSKKADAIEEEITEASEPEEVVLTDAEGRRYCRVKDCDQIAMVDTYCRYHYLLFWKNIQVRKKILTEGKLERYIEELTARYPDKYLEMLKKDLRSEKDFMAAIQELEIDDTSVDSEYEDEAQSYLEEVRGMSGDSPGREEEDF